MLSPDKIPDEQAQSEEEIRERFQHFALSVPHARQVHTLLTALPPISGGDTSHRCFHRLYFVTYCSYRSRPTILRPVETYCCCCFCLFAHSLPPTLLAGNSCPRYPCAGSATLLPTRSRQPRRRRSRVHIGHALPSIILSVIPSSPLRYPLHLTFRSTLVSIHHAQRGRRILRCPLHLPSPFSLPSASAHHHALGSLSALRLTTQARALRSLSLSNPRRLQSHCKASNRIAYRSIA